MRKPTMLLLAAAATFALANAIFAQTAAPPAKMGTKLITVGTAGGPVPRAGRSTGAQHTLVLADGTATPVPTALGGGDQPPVVHDEPCACVPAQQRVVVSFRQSRD